jgi:hypothetical protein
MITADDLKDYGWFSAENDKSIWFYDSWEYEFRIKTQELFYINDGMDEPELIGRITSMDELVKTYYALEHVNIRFEAMTKKVED